MLHSPSLVLIAAVISDRNRARWDWLKWLPHNQHPHANDGLGSARMVYPSLAAAAKALADLLPDHSPAHASAPPPLLVVVVDDDDDDARGVTSLRVDTGYDGPATAKELRLRVSENELATGQPGDDQASARPDQMSYTAALTCARRLAGYRAGRPDASRQHRAAAWAGRICSGSAISRPTPRLIVGTAEVPAIGFVFRLARRPWVHR